MRHRRNFTGKARIRFWLKGLLEYFDVKIVLSNAACGADFKWIFTMLPLANILYPVAYQYYSKFTPTISPLFPLLPAGANLPALNISTLASIAVKFTPTVVIPTVLSASALLGL